MIRLTGLVGGERIVLAEFHDPMGCEHACRYGQHAERKAAHVERRKAEQGEAREAIDRAARHARDPDMPEPEVPAVPDDLTDAELVALAAWSPAELSAMTPLPEQARGVKRDRRGNVLDPGEPDPERDEKTAAKLIATTALAYEQNGLAREVRIEVHE